MRMIWIVLLITGSALAADATLDPLLQKMIDTSPTVDESSFDEAYWKKHTQFIKAFDELAKRNGSDKYAITGKKPPGPDKTEKHGDKTFTIVQADPLDCFCTSRAVAMSAEKSNYVIVIFQWHSCTVPGRDTTRVLLFSAEGKYLHSASAENNTRFGTLKVDVNKNNVEIAYHDPDGDHRTRLEIKDGKLQSVVSP